MRRWLQGVLDGQRVSWDNPEPEMHGEGPAVAFYARLLVYGGAAFSVGLGVLIVLVKG